MDAMRWKRGESNIYRDGEKKAERASYRQEKPDTRERKI